MLARLRPLLLCSLALAPFAGSALPGIALAGEMSAWSAPQGTAARLVAGGSEDGTLLGGVEIRLAPGLKTYWRYPGDSGVPPHFDWSGSHNVEAVEVLWPAPVRFDDGGSFSIGYKHDVVLPLRITPKDRARPVELKLNLDFAVCGKICQPANAALGLAVPAGGAGAPSPALLQALATVPRPVALGVAGAPPASPPRSCATTRAARRSASRPMSAMRTRPTCSSRDPARTGRCRFRRARPGRTDGPSSCCRWTAFPRARMSPPHGFASPLSTAIGRSR
ncbi:protein-disulfide reductase DsbD domain-containing protein [Ancylobacter dichloromethanicus]